MNARTIALPIAGLLLATAANAAELPKTLAVTAYDVGSSGYSQAVAVGSAFKNNYGVTMRVLPGKNDVSRFVPLRDGKVDFSFNSSGTVFAQEGVDVFGTADWGPQRVRLMLSSMGDNCISLFWTEDLGIKEISGLKGKRVAFVKGSPALQKTVYAYLRFGGLTWDDVKLVEVGGNGAAFDAILNDQADIFASTTSSGSTLKQINSPRGIHWPTLDPDDKEAWKRMLEVTPYLRPHVCKESAGNLPAWKGASSPYPLIMLYDTGAPDLAYAVTKAMFEQYPNYKDAAPAASGYALEKQVMDYMIPYHEGAVRFYKEVGKWTPEIQANQEALIARQDALGEIWKAYKAKPAEGDFYDGWMKARYEGLEAAGLQPYWRTF